MASKRDEIRRLSDKMGFQVHVVPEKGSPWALDDGEHYPKQTDAEQAMTSYVQSQLVGGGRVGLDPRAGEFPGSVYVANGPDGSFRVYTVSRSAWDSLPPEESDELLSAAETEERIESEAAAAASRETELENARAEATLFALKRDMATAEVEKAELAELADRAAKRLEGLERAEYERKLADRRDKVLKERSNPVKPTGTARKP